MHICGLLSTFVLLSSLLYRSSVPCTSHESTTTFHLTACQEFSPASPIASSLFSLLNFSLTLRCHTPCLLLLLLLSGDIEVNPGPANFTICTLNIRSILHPTHSAALSGLISSHNPDLLCLTETWIKHTTTCTELAHCTPTNYSLLSFPRPFNSPNNKPEAAAGGTAFLIREPFTQLPSSENTFTSFESSSVTLKLPGSKISVFNVYRPPSGSHYSKPNSVFLDEFNSFLSLAATTPHEFIITGDFNIHVDSCTDHFTSQFLSLLSSFNLTQHVHFPTHKDNHTLDLVITSSDSSLSPSLSTSCITPSDHFPIFTKLSVSSTPLPAPTNHTFRRLHSIDASSILSDLQSSSLVSNPPECLDSLLPAYNSTLSPLLDKHAPVITKLSPLHQIKSMVHFCCL